MDNSGLNRFMALMALCTLFALAMAVGPDTLWEELSRLL
jgi:hypothetical protein